LLKGNEGLIFKMYVNKCTKCGAEFETKNPKRVICPNCLYPDRQETPLSSYNEVLNKPESDTQTPEQRPQQGGFPPRPQQGGYNNQGGSFGGRPQGGFAPRPQQGGYNNQGGSYGGRPQGGFAPRPQQGGFNRPPQQGGFRRPPQQGGYNNQGGSFGGRPQSGGFNRGGMNRRPAASKPLLISREQVAEIEVLYKAMLPLPNPDCHEVIGEKMGLEPNKVFFGINLIRQKLFLPKLPYPKRKLAVSPDQLQAVQNLYEPLLPLPPIGCHKFIAKQLKMDEWRVHVGIGIIRKQLSLPRWNPDREDAPAEFKNQEKPAEIVVETPAEKPAAKAEKKSKKEEPKKEEE